jgi:hypothetical protein
MARRIPRRKFDGLPTALMRGRADQLSGEKSACLSRTGELGFTYGAGELFTALTVCRTVVKSSVVLIADWRGRGGNQTDGHSSYDKSQDD